MADYTRRTLAGFTGAKTNVALIGARGQELGASSSSALPPNPSQCNSTSLSAIRPNQQGDGSGRQGSSVKPLYHHFVRQAKKLNPRYISLIIPARWFVSGRGLDSFRSEMLNDERIRILHDYPNSRDCFPHVEIAGGVCYFLWDRDHRGLCKVITHMDNGIAAEMERPLLEEGCETFIRFNPAVSILKKIKDTREPSLSQVLNAGRYFGFHTKVDWIDDVAGTLQTADGQSSFAVSSEKSKDKSIKVYIAHGTCWISKNDIVRNRQDVDKYKVIIPRTGSPTGSIIGKPIISEPALCSSNSYVVIIPQNNTLESAQIIISYLQTKFVRFLVSLRTTTQDKAPKAYSFVPLQDFGES